MIKRLVIFLCLTGAMLVCYNWLSNNLDDALGVAIFVMVGTALLVLYGDRSDD